MGLGSVQALVLALVQVLARAPVPGQALALVVLELDHRPHTTSQSLGTDLEA